jgi:transposase
MKKPLPPNVQVVAEKFHVRVQVNQELDTQRKGERKQVIDVVKNQNRPRSEHQ